MVDIKYFYVILLVIEKIYSRLTFNLKGSSIYKAVIKEVRK
mgnify:CR=1 FL=1